MLFCLRTRVGSSNQVLGVGRIARRNGQFWVLFHSLKCTKLCKQQTPQQPRAAQLCTLVILLAFSLLRDFRLTTIRTQSGGKVPEWFFPLFSAPFPFSPLLLLPCPSFPLLSCSSLPFLSSLAPPLPFPTDLPFLPSLRSRPPYIQLWGLGERFVYFSCKI